MESETKSAPPFDKNPFFIVLTVVLAILLIEGLSFAAWHFLIKSHVKNPILARCRQISFLPAITPNTFWHHELNPGHSDYHGRINSKGTIGPEFDIPKPEGELRIICLGDSTTEGYGLLDPDQTYPRHLERFLTKAVKLDGRYNSVKVINAGIRNANSAFNLAYLAFRLIHFEPDVVIIKSSYNDQYAYQIPGMKYDYTHAFPQPYAFDGTDNPYWIAARYSYFLKIAGAFLFKNEVYSPWKNFRAPFPGTEEARRGFEGNRDKISVYSENIRSMVLLCKGRGIRPYLLDLPASIWTESYRHLTQIVMKDFTEIIAAFEDELEKIAREENVVFIRTGPFEKNDFLDDCHLTPSGNLKVARKIYHTLVKS